MESEDRIHQHGESGKSLRAEVAELKEIVSTGMNILRDAAQDEGGGDPVNVSEEAQDALEAICGCALSGDVKSLQKLRNIASEIVSGAGCIGDSGRARGAHAKRGKRQRHASPKRRHSKSEKAHKLPERPVRSVDIEFPTPPIPAGEVTEFLNARDLFLRARADYERKRAGLLYKLQMLCNLEDQGSEATFSLTLDSDGDTLVIIDRTSVPGETIIDRR